MSGKIQLRKGRNMRLLITIRGNSCSGKTTLAKELQKRLGRGTMRLSQDVIRREILHVKDEPNPKSIPLLKLMLAYGHEHAEIVIPPFEEQVQIADYLDYRFNRFQSLVAKKQELLRGLREYRAAIISESITGRFKVPGV